MEKQAKRIFYCLVSSLLLNVSLILVIGLRVQETKEKEQVTIEQTYPQDYSKGYTRGLLVARQHYYENLKVIELALKNNKNIPWREIYENYR